MFRKQYVRGTLQAFQKLNLTFMFVKITIMFIKITIVQEYNSLRKNGNL